jgi:ribosomal protein L2
VIGTVVAVATAAASASAPAIARCPSAATTAPLLPLWRRAAAGLAIGGGAGSSLLPAATAAARPAARAAAATSSAAAPPPLLLLRGRRPPLPSFPPTTTLRQYATDFARKQAANPGLKFWKPTSPGQRGRVTVRREGVWKGKPMRALCRGEKRTGGRNHHGRITCRHRGGGHRRRLREVDFLRTAATGRAGVRGTVERIEYDPARSAYLALVRYDKRQQQRGGGGGGGGGGGAGGRRPSSGPPRAAAAPAHPPKEYGYILAPQGLSPGDVVISAAGGAAGGKVVAAAGASSSSSMAAAALSSSSPSAAAAAEAAAAADLAADLAASAAAVPIKPGNRLALADIPVGIPIHAVELRPGAGGQLARAAGTSAVVSNKQPEHGRAIVRLPSGEQRLVPLSCRATVGSVSNPQHKNARLGKAGASRHRGVRPTVRGVAMNPVDHPHGGRTAGGRPSVSPWARPAKGGRTRASGKPSDRLILVTRRQASRRGKE